MSVKPLDLQTNLSHMHEIAKGEQSRSAAVVEGRHVLEKDSGEKSKLINERLEENKKAEKTAIKREEERKKKKKRLRKDAETMEEAEEKSIMLKDDKIGRMIDVKR